VFFLFTQPCDAEIARQIVQHISSSDKPAALSDLDYMHGKFFHVDGHGKEAQGSFY
jgi:hypothetical protein